MTYAEQQAQLSQALQREEAQRAEHHQNHRGPCVPWRGAGGELGRCIYCGKHDPITQCYRDRQTGVHATLTASG